MEHETDTDALLDRVASGDLHAREQLLTQYRERLKRMINMRMDRRLAPRLDCSDVVQEALAEAAKRLSQYAQLRPIPFYPWLRQIAWDKLVELHRRHFRKKRSVELEEPMRLSDESVCQMADRLVEARSSPSSQLIRRELAVRVGQALDWLPAADREILMLRHLEQLDTSEAATVMGISESAAKSQHFRAMQRLLRYLNASDEGTSR